MNADDIIEAILDEHRRPFDNFLIDYGMVSYSRNYSGGAFNFAFRYNLKDLLLYLQRTNSLPVAFDIQDPNSFDDMWEFIKKVIDLMQQDRSNGYSTDGSVYRKRHREKENYYGR